MVEAPNGSLVCLANLGGSCLHSGGSWRPGISLPPVDENFDWPDISGGVAVLQFQGYPLSLYLMKNV